MTGEAPVTRIEFSGRLVGAATDKIIGGERITGAPVVAKLPGGTGPGDGSEWCAFVTAYGPGAEVLAGLPQGASVRVVGSVRTARSYPSADGSGACTVALEVNAREIERMATRV